MAAEVPSSFYKWGCSAILSWRPSPVTCPVFQLHGDSDQIIPLDRVRPTPTQVVRGGGHLLSLSHPAEVTAFISGVVNTPTPLREGVKTTSTIPPARSGQPDT